MHSFTRLSHSPDLDPNQSMFSPVPESQSVHGLVSTSHRKIGSGPNASPRMGGLGDRDSRSREASTDQSADVQQRIRSTHKALNSLVDVLDQKVSEILEFHELDFLRAFKHQMNLIAKELDILRKMMDSEVLRLAHDRKLRRLEKQVDYFRSQALRLKNDREGSLIAQTEYVSKIQLLQERLECAEQEKKFFEAFVIEASKENKELKLRVEKGEQETMKKIKQFAQQEAEKKASEVKSVNLEKKHQQFSKVRAEEALGLENGPGNKFFQTEPQFVNDSISKSKHSSQRGFKSEYLNSGGPGGSTNQLLAPPGSKPSKEGSSPSVAQTELQYWKSKFLTESKTAKCLKRELLDKAINKQDIINVMKNCILEIKRSLQLQKMKGSDSNSHIFDLEEIADAIKLKEFRNSDKLALIKNFLNHDFILDKLFDFVEQAPRQQVIQESSSQVLERVCGPTSCKSTAGFTAIQRQPSKSGGLGMSRPQTASMSSVIRPFTGNSAAVSLTNQRRFRVSHQAAPPGTGGVSEKRLFYSMKIN